MSLSMSPYSGFKQPKGTMVAIQALMFKPVSCQHQILTTKPQKTELLHQAFVNGQIPL